MMAVMVAGVLALVSRLGVPGVQRVTGQGGADSRWVMSERGLPGQDGDFPALAETLRAFRAGPLSGSPSDRALALAARVSPSTVGDWLRGDRFPQDIGKVVAVVRAVRAAAIGRGIAMPAGLLDDDRWREAHQREARRRSAAPTMSTAGCARSPATRSRSGPGARCAWTTA